MLPLLLSLAACDSGGVQTGPVPWQNSDGGWLPGAGPEAGPVALPGCAKDSDCPTPLICDLASGSCAVKGMCGAQSVKATATPPNLLLVLDRSCSMRVKLGWGGQSKWETAVNALTKLVSTYQGRIRFGLTLFPDTKGSSCTQDAVPVPVAPATEGKILPLLKSSLAHGDPNYPNGPCVTNIDTAMQQAATEPALADSSRSSFVLLITDGKQALCLTGGGDNGTAQTIKSLAQKKVSTFVVGFGTGISPYWLNIFADAGGKPSGGPVDRFYKAEDQTSLETALTSIANTAMGCQFTLAQVPATLQQVYVLLDSKTLPQDKTHKDGWDYDPSTKQVTLFGNACKSVQSGQVQQVDILLGCEAPKPPEPDAGPPCKPGVTPCTQQGDCPDKHGCVAGCCIKSVE